MDAKELEKKFGITSQELEERAEAYERGEWPPGKTTRMGRPPFSSDDELESISFRIPKSRLKAIEALSTKRGETRSEFLGAAVDKALRESA